MRPVWQVGALRHRRRAQDLQSRRFSRRSLRGLLRLHDGATAEREGGEDAIESGATTLMDEGKGMLKLPERLNKQAPRSPQPARYCRVCETALIPGQYFYCGPDCAGRAWYRRSRGQPISDQAFRVTWSERCLCCGDPIEPPKMRFCSTPCQMRYNARLRVGSPGSDAEFDKGQSATCAHCRREYTRYHKLQIYCSKACTRQAGKARERAEREEGIRGNSHL